MRLTLVLALILSLLTVLFALQNTDNVAVDFLFFQAEGSTAIVLLITFILGVVTGALAFLPGWLRSKREAKSLRQELNAPPPQPGSSATSEDASLSSPAPHDRDE